MSVEQMKSVAEKLVGFCQNHQEATALDTLYSADAVSVEATPMKAMDSAVVSGLDAIRAKHAWWESAMDVHESSVEGPFFHGEDRFGVIFSIDATNKQTSERMNMRELGVYTVKDGKIAREEFFYPY